MCSYMFDRNFTLVNTPAISTLCGNSTQAPGLTRWNGPSKVEWRAELDVWGSDHTSITIGLEVRRLKKIERNVKISHWD